MIYKVLGAIYYISCLAILGLMYQGIIDIKLMEWMFIYFIPAFTATILMVCTACLFVIVIVVYVAIKIASFGQL